MPLTVHAAHAAGAPGGPPIADPADPADLADLDDVAGFPHVEPDMARLSNQLACHVAPLPVRLAGRDWRLRFVTADAGIVARSVHGHAFTLGSARGRLCLDACGERMLLGVPGAAEALPELLRHALLADTCAPLVRALATLDPDAFTWQPAASGWPSNLPAFGLQLDADEAADGNEAPGRLHGVLQLDQPERLARLTQGLPAMAPHAGRQFDALPIPVALRIGTTTIAVGDTRGIVPGDIISIEHWQSQAGGFLVRCSTRRRGASWMALAEGRRVTALQDLNVQNGAHMEATDTPGMPHPDAEPSSLAQLDGLEVELRFEVGGVALPLAELRAVRTGFVFELPQPLRQSEVRIVANGTRIGTGTLIAVGNRLGVRVTTFAAGEA